MIIEKILKQITPERVKKEIATIQAIELPPELQKWVKEYEKVGERNEFTWKFIFLLNKIINPFSLTRDSKISEIKTSIIILIVLIDDAAEKGKGVELLNILLTNIFNSNLSNNKVSRHNKKSLVISTKIWKYIEKNISVLSLYKKMREIFRFDLYQVLNAIKYSYLVNKFPFLMNKTEHWLYAPFTLQGLVNCDIDLMSMSQFRLKEIGRIREIFLSVQKLARIANCLSTWEKEIYEGDLTNSIFVYAEEAKIITIFDLHKKNWDRKFIINRIKRSKVKTELLKEWENCYNKINKLCKAARSINRVKFLSQLRKLSLMYLIGGSLTKTNV